MALLLLAIIDDNLTVFNKLINPCCYRIKSVYFIKEKQHGKSVRGKEI